MLIHAPSEHMNIRANQPAQNITESYPGILLHHNFTSCKGVQLNDRWTKEEKAGYRSAFQYVTDLSRVA